MHEPAPIPLGLVVVVNCRQTEEDWIYDCTALVVYIDAD